jgi:uncharacterized protein YndB with AHSA1/START domain
MTIFTTSRSFSASPAAVYAAFAAPERLARWWGPDGFRNSISTFDLRRDGSWQFIMHGPDGANHPNEAIFLVVDPARTLVFKHVSPPLFQLTITLAGDAQGTLVTWEQAFESAEIAQAIRHIVEPANEQNLSRWQAEVAAG